MAQSQAPAAPSSRNIDILDTFNDGVMGSQDSQSDYSFAHFDLSDYVSNGDHLDIFTDHGSSQLPPAAHGGSMAMMNDSLVRQLQEIPTSQGRQLVGGAPAHQQMNEQHGVATPINLLHANISSSSSAVHGGPSSGPVTPIPVGQPAGGSDPATELLKEQLSKQLQLQRLQHLQNQLLQQQIDLISGGSSNSFDPTRLGLGGLLTPASSSEIRPIPPPDFMSPMLMQQQTTGYPTPHDMNNALYSLIPAAGVSTSIRGQHHQTMTAPASMVFYNSGQRTPNTDYFSPLTSPALGPSESYTSDGRQGSDPSCPFPPSADLASASAVQSITAQAAARQGQGRTRPKRRSSVDEPPSRKRPSPVSFPIVKQRQTTNSLKESPALIPITTRGGRSRASMQSLVSPDGLSTQSSEASGQRSAMQSTPSPVDLDLSSMPPPAPLHSVNVPEESMRITPPGYIAPVTPGSIMNLSGLSRLSTGLLSRGGTKKDQLSPQQLSPVSPMLKAGHSGSRTPIAETEDDRVASSPAAKKLVPILKPRKEGPPNTATTRARAPTKGSKPSPSSPAVALYGTSGGARSSEATAPKVGVASSTRGRSLISPNLKPILPGGIPADAVAHLSLKSNYQNVLEGRGKDLGIGFPTESHTGVAVKKTSHKAAEQKRRDSLKSGFDDLRILLPPITYDPDKDGDGAERPAGSLPPRGPPRNMPGVANEHPNRGVSKLALLRAANEHIVRLQRRVDRRDHLMEKMREELAALRLEVGVGTVLEDPEGEIAARMEEDEKTANERQCGYQTSRGRSLVWRNMALVDLGADVDAVEKDEDEERSARLAARPSERLAMVAAVAAAQVSSSSSTS